MVSPAVVDDDRSIDTHDPGPAWNLSASSLAGGSVATRRCLVAVVGILAVAGLAGCGGGGTAAPRSATGSTDTSAGPDVVAGDVPPPPCTLHQSGTDVRVTFDGEASAAACHSAVQNWSDANAFWSIGNPQPTGQLQTVCSLVAPDATVSVIVEDSGSAFVGTSLCGTLAHAGWTQAAAAAGDGPAKQSADDQSAIDDLAKGLTQDVAKLTDLDAQLEGQWQSVESSLAELRSRESGILKDAADAKASHCATFPSLPDPSAIGVEILQSQIKDLRTLADDVPNELARYQAVSARVVASSPPPDEATITATLDRAGERVVFWTARAKHAQSNADAIVAREEHAVAAAAC